MKETDKDKIRFIDPKKTKNLQKDWQGYGKAYASFGIIVLVIFILSILYHIL
jgi:hypothetical protein